MSITATRNGRLRYLHDWCQISRALDCATGHFEIGALLALKDEWQRVDQLRILMGNTVSARTRDAFQHALKHVKHVLDLSIEHEKEKNDFLTGVPAIVEGIRSGKIACCVYRKEKFHAKGCITHARLEVVGSAALVGSSNLSYPGLTENIELNVQITGCPVTVLQEWYEEHWAKAEDVSPEILQVEDLRKFKPSHDDKLRALVKLLKSDPILKAVVTGSYVFADPKPSPDDFDTFNPQDVFADSGINVTAVPSRSRRLAHAACLLTRPDSRCIHRAADSKCEQHCFPRCRRYWWR